MVEENIGLAHLCARRFLGRGMEYDDLFQAPPSRNSRRISPRITGTA